MEEYDVVILGCGPAGLSAAIFCGRAYMKTVVLGLPEKSQAKLASHIENYFGFPDGIDGSMLLNKGMLHAAKFGVQFLKEEAVLATMTVEKENKVFIVKTSKGKDMLCHALIIATGVPIRLSGITGEAELTGKGVHYCVWCDGPMYKNKKIAVIGSGDHAAEDAVEALTYSKDVTIISNADACAFSPHYQQELEKWGIKTVCAKVREFKGGKKLESLVFNDGTEQVFDSVFMACGSAGALDFAANLGIEIKDNTILVDEDNMTSIEGVFAAGNCEGRCRQIAKNVGDGCNAAMSAIRYLRPRKMYMDYGIKYEKTGEKQEETNKEIKENNSEVKAEPVLENGAKTEQEKEPEDMTIEELITEVINQKETDSTNAPVQQTALQSIKEQPESQEVVQQSVVQQARKLRIGWFSFSCCEDSTIVFTELLNDYYDKWKDIIDIRYCRPLKKNNELAELDIAFVEGAISNDKAASELRTIRLNSKKLIAIGACAATGMPSGQRNEFDERRKREIQPIIRAFDMNKNVMALHELVKVDDTVPGCPMLEAAFLNVVNKYIKEFGVDAQL